MPDTLANSRLDQLVPCIDAVFKSTFDGSSLKEALDEQFTIQNWVHNFTTRVKQLGLTNNPELIMDVAFHMRGHLYREFVDILTDEQLHKDPDKSAVMKEVLARFPTFASTFLSAIEERLVPQEHRSIKNQRPNSSVNRVMSDAAVYSSLIPHFCALTITYGYSPSADGPYVVLSYISPPEIGEKKGKEHVLSFGPSNQGLTIHDENFTQPEDGFLTKVIRIYSEGFPPRY